LGQFAFTRRTVKHAGKLKQRKKLTRGGKNKFFKHRGKLNLTLKKFGKKKVKRWA
jgi:hypothetical protein